MPQLYEGAVKPLEALTQPVSETITVVSFRKTGGGHSRSHTRAGPSPGMETALAQSVVKACDMTAVAVLPKPVRALIIPATRRGTFNFHWYLPCT